MNERIRELAEQATSTVDVKHEGYRGKGYTEQVEFFDKKKFAELIVRECDRLNRLQSFELAGVVADVEQGAGFDSVCLDTVKRVESYLSAGTLTQQFGVEE